MLVQGLVLNECSISELLLTFTVYVPVKQTLCKVLWEIYF